MSSCCDSRLRFHRPRDIFVGSCLTCESDVVRINPRTRQEEFLDGRPFLTGDNGLRLVNRCG